jgi:hypothetical protein
MSERKPNAEPDQPTEASQAEAKTNESEATPGQDKPASLPREIGGAKGPEPTRYGDWESNGRCTDF